jgi:hypothetical protein
MEETVGKKIPGHGCVVGEICQTENLLPFHPRIGCEESRRYDQRNFYYVCIYSILKDRNYPREKTLTLNHLKAKTVRQHSKRVQSITIDTHEATLFQGEIPSLFHLLHMWERRESRLPTSTKSV